MKINRPIPAANLKLLIFDLDGTLVDSRVDLANSINAMLRHFRCPELPTNVIAGYIGDGAPMLVRRALGDPGEPGDPAEKSGDKMIHEALAFFLAHYREHKLDNTYVYGGVVDALNSVRAAGNGSRQLAVLSNKPVVPSRQILHALGLGEFFFKVYGGNSFKTKKPDPLGVNSLLREAHAKPAQTVMVGDSDIDILTARNAGIYSIGCQYGLAPHTLEAAPPDVLVESPHEWIRALSA